MAVVPRVISSYALLVSGSIPSQKKEEGAKHGRDPKTVFIARIRSRSGPDAAGSANEELPDKLDLDSDTDARLLLRYDLEPDKLREEFGGVSPSIG